MSPRKITTVVERIDQMLASYAELERDAHDLMDCHVAECLAVTPGESFGVIKQREFTGRAGYVLNVPAALRLLREKF